MLARTNPTMIRARSGRSGESGETLLSLVVPTRAKAVPLANNRVG